MRELSLQLALKSGGGVIRARAHWQELNYFLSLGLGTKMLILKSFSIEARWIHTLLILLASNCLEKC